MTVEAGVSGGKSSGARRLREAHAHIAGFGESLSLLDLAGCRSVGECLEAITGLARAAEAHDPRESRAGWVLAFGARVESWSERRWPTIEELDDATRSIGGKTEGKAGVPCVIKSFDHHSASVNSRGMALAKISAGSRVDGHGVVVVDREGRATGLVLEEAAQQAWNAVPTATMEARRGQVRDALRVLSGLGYVEVHDMLSQEWLGPILRDLEETDELPVERVWLYPLVGAFEPAVKEWESERVRLAGGKVFADGTLNSRTALMLHPYRDGLAGLERGQAMVTPAELEGALRRVSGGPGLVDRSAARGHLAVHAIGDGAVRMVLDAVERVKPRADEMGITARIEHCELIDEADVARFSALGVVASVQPCHLLYDVEALTRYVPGRLDRVLPVRELLDSGCAAGMLTAEERRERRRAGKGCGEVWFGSDVPVVRANPEDSVAAATGIGAAGIAPGYRALNPRGVVREGEAWECFRAG